MLVEEIPKKSQSSSSTIYFSSSINLTARPSRNNRVDGDQDEQQTNKGRAKVNYNVNHLMLAQTQANDVQSPSSLKSSQQVQVERIISKRLAELNKDPNPTFDLPKGFEYKSIHSSHDAKSNKSRLGNTPTTKRILAARRNLNSYFEEERNLISINSILNLNYQFVDFSQFEQSKRRKIDHVNKPKLRLCCICGNKSNYTRCSLCGLYSCSVKCNRLHNESRCL